MSRSLFNAPGLSTPSVKIVWLQACFASPALWFVDCCWFSTIKRRSGQWTFVKVVVCVQEARPRVNCKSFCRVEQAFPQCDANRHVRCDLLLVGVHFASMECAFHLSCLDAASVCKLRTLHNRRNNPYSNALDKSLEVTLGFLYNHGKNLVGQIRQSAGVMAIQKALDLHASVNTKFYAC